MMEQSTMAIVLHGQQLGVEVLNGPQDLWRQVSTGQSMQMQQAPQAGQVQPAGFKVGACPSFCRNLARLQGSMLHWCCT